MVESQNQSHFEECLKKFYEISLDEDSIVDFEDISNVDDDFEVDASKNKAYYYFKKNWEPIKDKWAAHLTKKLAHFGCVTTQRAESGHSALKVNMTKRMDLFTAFEHMDKYWNGLEDKFRLMNRQESQKVDIYMVNNQKLNEIRMKVSRAALIAAHSACLAVDSMTPNEKEKCVDITSCNCSARLNYLLPCIHTVLDLGQNNFNLNNINQRWYLNREHYEYQANFSDTNTIVTFPVNEAQDDNNSWSKTLSKLELKFRQLKGDTEKIDRLEELISKAITESEMTEDAGEIGTSQVLQMPISEDVRKIGRPKKEICYLPAWKKLKNHEKTRVEQVESKVITGQVKKIFRLLRFIFQ